MKKARQMSNLPFFFLHPHSGDSGLYASGLEGLASRRAGVVRGLASGVYFKTSLIFMTLDAFLPSFVYHMIFRSSPFKNNVSITKEYGL